VDQDRHLLTDMTKFLTNRRQSMTVDDSKRASGRFNAVLAW
jgi:hypothetical protein